MLWTARRTQSVLKRSHKRKLEIIAQVKIDLIDLINIKQRVMGIIALSVHFNQLKYVNKESVLILIISED